MSSKSFLIKDILSENCESSSSSSSTTSDESTDQKDLFLTTPIDLRRFFKHPLCPIPLRATSLKIPTTTLRHTNRLDDDTKASPLNALFEMTKKTFDKSSASK